VYDAESPILTICTCTVEDAPRFLDKAGLNHWVDTETHISSQLPFAFIRRLSTHPALEQLSRSGHHLECDYDAQFDLTPHTRELCSNVQSATRPTPYKISTSQPRQYRREGKGKSNKERASASLTLALIQRFQSNSRQSGSAVCDKSAIVFVAIHSTAHPGLIDPTFQRVFALP
jgi:hypothetical protein